ncbi:MAG: AAA family ATPase [Alphaproteobacteria bacterium]|nr:AAA family ATPase [Alphaproteobacteria bacterium]
MQTTSAKQLDFNPIFQDALTLMEETGTSLFITGKAGTGKSTLLDYFQKNSQKNHVVLAPTGVAALNVKGQTIHRFFGFSIDITPQKIADKEFKPRTKNIYKQLKTIIIDEVSMLRADLVDCIDLFLRMYGPSAIQPFGGVQMIFVGDLYQLPPVVTAQETQIFSTLYQTPYFFSAHVFAHCTFKIIELEKIYRQKDQIFIDLLNRIRNNHIEEGDLQKLNSRLNIPSAPEHHFMISLTSTNKKADEINQLHLENLKGKPLHFQATIKGDFGKEFYPTATELQFKINAQIMLLNNDADGRWVNGSIGIITDFEQDEEGKPYILVKLQDDGGYVQVYPYSWEVFRFALADNMIISEPVGQFIQFPFRLAWAVTIHKSQGKTFDHVIIDIGRGTFAPGQMYVALSRCTSFEGIELKTPILKHHIRTDSRIISFLSYYQHQQAEKECAANDKAIAIKQAIQESSELEIIYRKNDDTTSTYLVKPISVGSQQYLGKIFPGVVAYCGQHQEERMFRIDRIMEIIKK